MSMLLFIIYQLSMLFYVYGTIYLTKRNLQMLTSYFSKGFHNLSIWFVRISLLHQLVEILIRVILIYIYFQTIQHHNNTSSTVCDTANMIFLDAARHSHASLDLTWNNSMFSI